MVTRLDDGSHVVVSKPALVPRIERCLTELRDASVKVAALMCTGTFPPFAVPEGLLLLRGQQVVDNGVRAACPGRGQGGRAGSPARTGGFFRRQIPRYGLRRGYRPRQSLWFPGRRACGGRGPFGIGMWWCCTAWDTTATISGWCARLAARPTLQANALMARLAAEVAGA